MTTTIEKLEAELAAREEAMSGLVDRAEKLDAEIETLSLRTEAREQWILRDKEKITTLRRRSEKLYEEANRALEAAEELKRKIEIRRAKADLLAAT
jgi:chromosome segregation ATPase